MPAIVGFENETDYIKNEAVITVCCAEGKTGFVYEAGLPYKEKTVDFSHITFNKTGIKIGRCG